jgi:hypothetical protein
MKSLAEIADMKERGEKIDVHASYKGRHPKPSIKDKRRNENRAIQKRARQRLKREMYENIEDN